VAGATPLPKNGVVGPTPYDRYGKRERKNGFGLLGVDQPQGLGGGFVHPVRLVGGS
jgi:hypothetical protein